MSHWKVALAPVYYRGRSFAKGKELPDGFTPQQHHLASKSVVEAKAKKPSTK